MSFFVDADDKQFKIYGIFGDLSNSTLDRCHSEQEKISQEFREMFPEAEYNDFFTFEHDFAESVFIRENNFIMPSGVRLNTQCVDVRNDDFTGDKDLMISLISPELYSWLRQP